MADDFNNSIQRSITMVKGDTLSFGFQVSGLEGQVLSAGLWNQVGD